MAAIVGPLAYRRLWRRSAGKKVLLANKEALVMSGALVYAGGQTQWCGVAADRQ